MIGFGYSIFGFLVAIAILLAVHEFGHFWVARKMGVKVLRFSIGFGKSLFSWRRKGDPTEYSIGLIPLGGYVKMLDEREGDVPESEQNQAFNRKSLSARSAIVAAGPIFNFLFAIVAIWFVFIAGSDDIRPMVGHVVADSVAEKAGFRKGDKIVDIDGRRTQTWGQHQFYILHQAMKGNEVKVAVENQDSSHRLLMLDFSTLDQATISSRSITSQIGLWPTIPRAVVDQIVENSPASESGLIPGDLILEINGDPVADWSVMVEKVSGSPGEKLSLLIQRGEERVIIDIVPKTVTVEGKQYGQIGLYRPPLEVIDLSYGPFHAVWASVEYNWRMTAITLRSLGRMLTSRMSSENLSGPITIARLAGHTAESGYIDFLKFLALISISLGLLNLLPIPVLDGGHLVYFAIEAIIGRPPSERFMIWGQQIGILLLMLLMAVAFYNDIVRLFQ
ncbi:MAG: RIP metalloprotease RseP [Gammaproteobacteria bacterium]|nr:RIP metalloprotease RseP [Gammaproteobacteria bacterium]